MTIQNSEFKPDSSRIHLLPEHLVDQIKAGEVIERPASLIKEILENSIDAGATKIDLHIVNNGMDLISLIDDGAGMTFNELPFAFCRHATSKIERFEDLYHLNSYGFRGEALASIAAVARVTCTSSPQENSSEGGKIIYHGGECLAHDQQANLPKGTSFFIKDLFFNTPARLKFIKSAQSEKNAIKRMVEASLLANPQVSFSLKWDDQDKVFFPATEEPQKRVAQVLLPKIKEKNLYSFNAEYEGHRVTGYFSHTSSRGNAYKRQYLFANNRIFTDRQLHQTIIRNLEKLYPQGESGHYCVFIDVPENLIDVNVHPNKTQIKFFKLPVITALLSSQIKKLSYDFGEQPSLLEGQTFHNESDEAGHSFSQSYSGSSQERPSFSSENFYPQAGSSHFQEGHYRPRPSHDPCGTNHSVSQISSSTTLHPDLFFHQKEEGTYVLVSLSRFWGVAIDRLKEMTFETDKEFIPLLISEPFSLTALLEEEKRFSELENIGVLCERVDQKTVAVRAVHQYLDPLDNAADFAEKILTSSNQENFNFPWPYQRIQKLAQQLGVDSKIFEKTIDLSFYQKNFK